MVNFYASSSPDITEMEKEHLKIVRSAASEGMVLLENINKALPISISENIALFGAGARKTVKGGTGSGDVNQRNVVTVEDGFENAGFKVTTKAWLDDYDKAYEDAEKEYAQKIIDTTNKNKNSTIFATLFSTPFLIPSGREITKVDMDNSKADTAVYVIARNSGEGVDRSDIPGDYELFETEKKNLSILGSYYKKVIVVLNVGGVIDTKFFKETDGLSALLLMSQAGQESGDSLVDILLGKAVPSGKLTATWAENYSDYPSSDTFSHNDGDVNEEYYNEGIFVGYRYFDSFGKTPAYPFGYGLSYTDFSIKCEDFSADENEISLKAFVKNTGNVSGMEVVQIYYSAPQGKLDKPYQELAAFGKTKLLAPGEGEFLTITFKTSSMASYSEDDAAWILEKGVYYLRVGNSSRNTVVAAAVCLENDAVTEKLGNKFKTNHNFNVISNKDAQPYSYENEDYEMNTAKVYKLSSEKFETSSAVYTSLPLKEFKKPDTNKTITVKDILNGSYTVRDLVSQLSETELENLCIGENRNKSTNVLGMASSIVPGAAGQTSSVIYESRGIPGIVLADGPAGLRLTNHFKISDKDGSLILPENSINFPGTKYLAPKSEKKEEDVPAKDYYQYATAIPIGTLIAQSWNTNLIYELGFIVGQEMNKFGVDLWLAPGMNIHRNPLCGRNFEYYSEDPLLTGICAAYDTLGVQKNPGVGTTIKHFAANSQEDNRMGTNSNITERTMREIYLKGFEIAVRMAQPMSVMTSYNLINGHHSANNYDLTNSVLRDEWGFKGFVMTDWGTTGSMMQGFDASSVSYASMCVHCGNDLTMPGVENDHNNIKKALSGENVPQPLMIADLQACAERIINIVLKSSKIKDSVPYGNTDGWFIMRTEK